jgi:hypothetical protein
VTPSEEGGPYREPAPSDPAYRPVIVRKKIPGCLIALMVPAVMLLLLLIVIIGVCGFHR